MSVRGPGSGYSAGGGASRANREYTCSWLPASTAKGGGGRGARKEGGREEGREEGREDGREEGRDGGWEEGRDGGQGGEAFSLVGEL